MQKLTIMQLADVGEVKTLLLHPQQDTFSIEVRTQYERYELVDEFGFHLLVNDLENARNVIEQKPEAIAQSFPHMSSDIVH